MAIMTMPPAIKAMPAIMGTRYPVRWMRTEAEMASTISPMARAVRRVPDDKGVSP